MNKKPYSPETVEELAKFTRENCHTCQLHYRYSINYKPSISAHQCPAWLNLVYPGSTQWAKNIITEDEKGTKCKWQRAIKAKSCLICENYTLDRTTVANSGRCAAGHKTLKTITVHALLTGGDTAERCPDMKLKTPCKEVQ